MAVNKDKPLNEAIQELTIQIQKLEAKASKSSGTDFREALDKINVETFFPSFLNPIGRAGQKTANVIQGLVNVGRNRKLKSLRSQLENAEGELGSEDVESDISPVDLGGDLVGDIGGMGGDITPLIEVMEGVVLSIENMSESTTEQLEKIKYCLEDIADDVEGIVGHITKESRIGLENRREAQRAQRAGGAPRLVASGPDSDDDRGGMMGGLLGRGGAMRGLGGMLGGGGLMAKMSGLLGVAGLAGLIPIVGKMAIIAAGLATYMYYYDDMVEGIANFLVGNERGRKSEEEFLRERKAFLEDEKAFFDRQVGQYDKEQKLSMESDIAEISNVGLDQKGLDRPADQQSAAARMAFGGDIREIATLTDQATRTRDTVKIIREQQKRNEADAADTRMTRVVNMIGSGLMTVTGLGYLFGGSPDEDFSREFNSFENAGLFSDENLDKAVQNANRATSLAILANYVDQDNDDALSDTELVLLQSFMEKGIHLAPPEMLVKTLKRFGGVRTGRGSELQPDIDAGGQLSSPTDLLRDLQSSGFELPTTSSGGNSAFTPTRTERELGITPTLEGLGRTALTPITNITNINVENTTPQSGHFQGTPVDYSDGKLFK